MILVILVWLTVWLVCHTPSVHPWNDWFVWLLISIAAV